MEYILVLCKLYKARGQIVQICTLYESEVKSCKVDP